MHNLRFFAPALKVSFVGHFSLAVRAFLWISTAAPHTGCLQEGSPEAKVQFISLGGKATQAPTGRVTQTQLSGRIHRALLGKDDGSLHPNSLKLKILVKFYQ